MYVYLPMIQNLRQYTIMLSNSTFIFAFNNSITLLLRCLSLFLLLIICYVGRYVWINRDFYKKINKFYSLPTVPLFGNMIPVIRSRKGRIETMLEIAAKYEAQKPFVFWLFYLPLVVVSSYEDIQIVSNKSYWRNARGKFRKIVGDGIALSHPDKWRNIRRMINPAFGPAMLQQYLTVFNRQSEILCRRLNDDLSREDGKKKTVDIFCYMGDLNLDMIAENMAGINLQVQENGGNEFAESLATSLKLESSRFFEPWLYPDSIYYLYLLCSGQKDLYNKLHKMPSEVVETKLENYREQKEKLKVRADGPIEDRPVKTFIDILVRLQDAAQEFTTQQMHDEILAMIAAGSESTAIVSSFTLLMLAIHQDAQERVYREIKNVCGGGSSTLTIRMEHLVGGLKYLEQCIKETLRRFTLAPIMFREATEEITLTDGLVIPTGAMVAMVYYLVHQDPSAYPNPDVWDPEHFAVENSKSPFIPFGTGARACIGSKYAMISLKSQIAHVLRRFHLSTNISLDDIELEYDLLIRKKGGYPVTISLRVDDDDDERSLS